MVVLLLICTCAYAHSVFPGIMDRNKDGVFGIFWKCARVGERLSPWVSIGCVCMAVSCSCASRVQQQVLMTKGLTRTAGKHIHGTVMALRNRHGGVSEMITLGISSEAFGVRS